LEPIDGPAQASLSSSPPDDSFEDSSLLTFGSVTDSDLLDTTNFVLQAEDLTAVPPIEAGDFETPVPAGAPGVTNFAELREFIVTSTQGWFREFNTGAVAGDPSERVADRTEALRDQLFFTAFTPSAPDREDICIGGEGSSNLFVINQSTGTASPFATLGDTSGIINTAVTLGPGTASSPVLFVSEAFGSNSGLPISQRDNGSLSPQGAVKIPIDDLPLIRSGWREILQ